MAEPRPPSDRRSPRRAAYWLWMLVIALGSLLATAAIVNAFLPADRATHADAFGQDFLAFYAAGQMALDGRAADLYDLAATARLQTRIAADAGYARAAPVAPWLNPPHVAWLFAPLALLPFRGALACWTLLNLACLATAATLLARIVGEVTERRRDRWLVPALLAVAPPTVQALGHGQNALVSLLLLTVTVAAWRDGRALVAGVACALLAYKPQLAAVAGVGLIATLGWRVIVGLLLGLVPQLLAAVVTLPGSVADFVARVPGNLHALQIERAFPWHRHVTFAGFWRTIAQGDAAGATHAWVAVLATASALAVVAAVIAVWWKLRPTLATDGIALDRFIALVVIATPLAVPYFVDYDLLLLAVAGVLVARDAMASEARDAAAPWLGRAGALTIAWTLVNPPLAAATGVGLTVPLLVTLFALQARRCTRDAAAVEDIATATPIDAPPATRLAA